MGNTPFTCEYKYDGERIQIHVISKKRYLSGDLKAIKAFSRNAEENTSEYLSQLYQDVCTSIGSTDSCILEGEVVAMNKEGEFLPFQQLKTINNNKLVCLFAFDLLYCDGTTMVEVSNDDYNIYI